MLFCFPYVMRKPVDVRVELHMSVKKGNMGYTRWDGPRMSSTSKNVLENFMKKQPEMWSIFTDFTLEHLFELKHHEWDPEKSALYVHVTLHPEKWSTNDDWISNKRPFSLKHKTILQNTLMNFLFLGWRDRLHEWYEAYLKHYRIKRTRYYPEIDSINFV